MYQANHMRVDATHNFGWMRLAGPHTKLPTGTMTCIHMFPNRCCEVD